MSYQVLKSLNKYTPYINAASRAIRTGKKMYRSYNKVKRLFKGNKSNDVYTNQYDRSVVYRKRKMPRRKRKQWKRFSRKVQAVTSKSKGLQSVVYTHATLCSGALGSTGQEFYAAHLYGKNGYGAAATEDGCADLRKIVAGYPAEITDYPSKILHFRNAILTTTLHNTGECTLELDIYHVRWGEKQYATPTFRKAHDYTKGDTEDMDGTSNNFLRFRGTTLWDMSEFLSRNNCKILKMTRVTLGVGQTTQYQIRNTRNKIVSTNEIVKPNWTLPGPDPDPVEDGRELVYSGLTESVIVVYRPPPSITAKFCALTCTSTRSYRFVIDELATPAATQIEQG